MRRSSVLRWVLLVVVIGGAIAALSLVKLSRSVPSQASSPGAAAPAASAGAVANNLESAKDTAKEKNVAGGQKKPDDPKTWKRSEVLSNTSRLMVGDKEALPLRAAEIKVQVDGFRARVLLDLFYENDRDGRYEGTFQLRLPNEASPYFFAFGATAYASDPTVFASLRTFENGKHVGNAPEAILAERASTWSEPTEARVVPREKAAFAYTETERRRVDPALLEWAGAGIFNARVFPLEPHKVHRIVVGYDVSLLPVGDDLELSIDTPDQVKSLLVDLELGDLAAATQVTPAPSQQEGKRYYRYVDPTERTIVVRVKKPGVTLIAGEDPKTGPYFATSFRPDLDTPGAASPGAGSPGAPSPGAAPPGTARPKSPGSAGATSPEKAAGGDQAVFLVDTSMSANPDAFNVQLEILEAVLENNRATLKKAAVLFFNVGQTWYRDEFFDNTPDNVKALLEYARNLSLEGATDLGAALDEAARPSWFMSRGKAPLWPVFLLSDGAATWGESDPFALIHALASGFAGPLYAYRTGLAGSDTATLSRLAKESGGAVFSVVSESEVAAASTAHQARPWEIKSVELEGGSDLLLAGRPKTLFAGQRLVLVGRGTPAKDAEVVLTVEQGYQKKTVRTRIARTVQSPLAARAYGEVAVAAIEDLEDALEPTAIAYATHFRVTGRTCSLLMLESQADYDRFGIHPGDSESTVRSSPAAAAIEKAWKVMGDAIGDPKLAFLAMLGRLEKMPEVALHFSPEARAAIEAIPRSAFEVNAPRLVPKHPAKDGVPGNFVELSQMKNLDYDSAVAEADRRRAAYGTVDALVALSSLVEQSPGDGVLARDVGLTALSWDLPGAAYHLFRRVAAARPFEPQTYVAIAASLERMKNADLAMAYYEIALAGTWPQRFGEFHQIASLDYAHLLAAIRKGQLTTSATDYAKGREAAIVAQFGIAKADLVVVITWNTDATDIDLHVIEPTGEECFYKNRKTKIGGMLTRDVTQGYGPEMYVLPEAKAGQYRVFAHYFASHQNRLSARTKVYATVVEGWGTDHEKVTEKVVLLQNGKDDHDILTVTK